MPGMNQMMPTPENPLGLFDPKNIEENKKNNYENARRLVAKKLKVPENLLHLDEKGEWQYVTSGGLNLTKEDLEGLDEQEKGARYH
jgi:hypothetical protein